MAKAWSKDNAGCIQFLSPIPRKQNVLASSILNVKAKVSSDILYLAFSLSANLSEVTMVGDTSVSSMLVGKGTGVTFQLELSRHCNLDSIWANLSVTFSLYIPETEKFCRFCKLILKFLAKFTTHILLSCSSKSELGSPCLKTHYQLTTSNCSLHAEQLRTGFLESGATVIYSYTIFR